MVFNGVSVNMDWSLSVSDCKYFADHFTHLLSKEEIEELWGLIQLKKGKVKPEPVQLKDEL